MKHIVPFRVLTKSLSLTAALAAASMGCGPTQSGNAPPSGTSASPEVAAAQSAWSEAIAATPAAAEGCFHSAYPSMSWEQVDCAPATSFLSHPAPSGNGVTETVGNGSDYAAETTGLISKAIGTFPTVAGLKTETDDGTSNTYSIQLNSNFMSGTKACKGTSGCQSWSQFVYSSTQESAFIQNWLLGVDSCPSGWNDAGSGSCYKNSSAVSVPQIPITSLSTFKMSGAATSSKDSLVFTAAGDAYSTSQADSTTGLSTAWNASEFNIIGDGGASEAVFNTGSSVTVKIALTDGSTSAPTCASNAGTTGETNDLKIGKCTTKGGSSPYVEFKESR